MAWIEYSYRLDTRVAAPIDWVWRYLVDPQYMPASREAFLIAVTAEGTPGETGHVFFTEVQHDHGPHAFKSKVLRGEEPSVWATLTEVAGWSGKEFYTLTEVDDGRATDVRFLGSSREQVGQQTDRQKERLRRRGAERAHAAEEEAAAYFSRVVAEAYKAALEE